MARKIVDLDVAAPALPDDLNRYSSADVLVRWRGKPVGRCLVPGPFDDSAKILRWIIAEKAGAVARAALHDRFFGSRPVETSPASATVVICTRERPEDLDRCLKALCESADAKTEILVVDNAPVTKATETIARKHSVRYICETRQGLNWARAAGAKAASGELVLFTDDDVVVDGRWIDELRRPFADPLVAAVTGLIMPLECESDAQQMFEDLSGFSRGFEEKRFHWTTLPPINASRVGAGASMAVRRDLIIRHGLFDSELDCGTAAQSGGDTYAFYRLLRLGHQLVYNPEALAWHRHRRNKEDLEKVFYGYSVGVYCYLLRCLFQHSDISALHTGLSWFADFHLRGVWKAFSGAADAPPAGVVRASIRGVLAAPKAYFLTRRRERRFKRLATQST